MRPNFFASVSLWRLQRPKSHMFGIALSVSDVCLLLDEIVDKIDPLVTKQRRVDDWAEDKSAGSRDRFQVQNHEQEKHLIGYVLCV